MATRESQKRKRFLKANIGLSRGRILGAARRVSPQQTDGKKFGIRIDEENSNPKKTKNM